MKVLLIEDEPKLNSFIKKGLRQNGYVVDAVGNGSEGLEIVSTNDYDIVILDVMLPGQNGYEVLKNMRDFNVNVPVIMISALGDTENVIKGLDMGATDYLRKPFSFDELLARIRVATRSNDDNRTYTKLTVKDLTLDLLARKVWRSDKEIFVTNREFNLLRFLMLNANRVVSKTEIAERV
ncbi:MAG: response regulator transcription factor, partial [Bacteroidota bacterium]